MVMFKASSPTFAAGKEPWASWSPTSSLQTANEVLGEVQLDDRELDRIEAI